MNKKNSLKNIKGLSLWWDFTDFSSIVFNKDGEVSKVFNKASWGWKVRRLIFRIKRWLGIE